MYQRIFNINNELDMSVFLFGARQTGKSTLLRKAVSKAVYIDLLDSDIRKLYRKRPAYLYDQLAGKDSSCVVIIDEIPEVPDLLNEVHRLISEFGIRFVLCGSSARKLKRKGYNTLGGRAFPCYFYPLVSAEIPDLDIDRAVNNGMMPLHYPAKNATRLLASYVDVYLKEEIQAEALVRDLDNFERFLEVAALTDGEMVNYANIASDCGVSAKTVKEYFSILQDTLVGYTIPAYTKVMKRRLVQAPRFYFFDVGVANYLLHRQNLVRGTVEFGHAFEHWVIQEIIAYIGYTHNENRLSYWRTYTGIEVDAVIGDARLAIEIKSVAEVLPKHLTGLKTFMEEHPDTRPIIVSLDRISRRCGEMESLYVMDFLRMLWAGELF
ncbi:MAG: ATP-binding protein [Bacteroidales bacterium]|nr:ATP-binding protein [Bacteroidales bacterium]